MKSLWIAGLVAGLLAVGQPALADPVPYPDIADISHTTPESAKFFRSFFAVKTKQDPVGTMSYFSKDLLTYTDATLGWPLSYEVLDKAFTANMPNWKDGMSYPVKILGGATGGEGSVLLSFTDTPQLFGGELHILGAVDIRGGKIVRWVDYWDSSAFDDAGLVKMQTPADKFPTDFREKEAGQVAGARMVDVATKLQAAIAAGKTEDAAALFTYDAKFEDMALRASLFGRSAIGRYFGRVHGSSPYAEGARLRHVIGTDQAGGFEWFGAPASGVRGGIMALTLDQDGKISSAEVVYDSRMLKPGLAKSLTLLAAEK